MFNRLFRINASKNKTGIYFVEGNKLTELEESPGNGSINSIIEILGYEIPQIHTIFTFDSKNIECIGVKVFSKEPIFVLAKKKNSQIDWKLINRELSKIDWKFEYSSHAIEDILNDGIDSQSLTLDFLSSVTMLKQEGESLFLAQALDLYLSFKDGILENFTSSEWANASAKWLKEVNKNMYEGLLTEAKQFHRNEIEAMEELNLQCEALQGIPAAINNEFISLHTKANGNINFYNLLAAHYEPKISIEEFEIVNKGRFGMREEFVLEVDKFVFHFDADGLLVGAMQK